MRYRHSKTLKFTKKYVDVWRVCPAIHTSLINFQVYKRLYLVQYWLDQHQTWDFTYTCNLNGLFLTTWQ